jgi:5'-nucleotidase
MLEFPKKLSEARVLIANDDSIHAEGIKVLEEILLSITPHVWVVAPETQMSAAGHSLTIHMPLRIKEYDKRHYSVYGTPTDSVLMGVQKVMQAARPHIVLSGINHGQNTADDVTYSGTIAAAIEATLMAIPAIACSQDFDEQGKPDWSVAREYLPKILQAFEGKSWDHNILMSVNFPIPRAGVTPEIRVVPQGHYRRRRSASCRRGITAWRSRKWCSPSIRAGGPITGLGRRRCATSMTRRSTWARSRRGM